MEAFFSFSMFNTSSVISTSKEKNIFQALTFDLLSSDEKVNLCCKCKIKSVMCFNCWKVALTRFFSESEISEIIKILSAIQKICQNEEMNCDKDAGLKAIKELSEINNQDREVLVVYHYTRIVNELISRINSRLSCFSPYEDLVPVKKVTLIFSCPFVNSSCDNEYGNCSKTEPSFGLIDLLQNLHVEVFKVSFIDS